MKLRSWVQVLDTLTNYDAYIESNLDGPFLEKWSIFGLLNSALVSVLRLININVEQINQLRQ